MGYNYQPLLEDVIIPDITETYFLKDVNLLTSLFTDMPAAWRKGGPVISKTMRTAVTSNVSDYDRTDVNPESGDSTFVQAYWNKKYTHSAFEVHGIDINEAKNGGLTTITDLIKDAAAVEYAQFRQKLFANLYAMLKADIDSAATYSDAALSRSTYTTLASFEDSTDTAITLALLRTAKNTILLNENTMSDQYIHLMEQAVMNVFNPLAAALHTWNTEGVKGASYAAGHQIAGSWEGNDVVTIPGMTTGDTFLLRPQDVYVYNHRPFEIEQVESGKDSAKFVIRAGFNLFVDNPGLQGKQTSKD